MTDVAVIGAGLGGLACAVDLAARDLSVTVLERHSLVGGYASSFSRGPFTFDVSQHCLGGLGDGQSFGELLARLEVADRLTVAVPPALCTLLTPDENLSLPNGPRKAVAPLIALAPSEGERLARLFDECASIHQDTVAGALDNDIRRLVQGMRRAGDRTFGEVLDDAIDSDRLRFALSVPWVLLGLPPSRAAYSWFAKVLATTYLEGCAHIVGGGQALADAMAERVRELGGTVMTSTPAVEIVTEGGTVKGVETQSGFVDASAVVAALDPWTLADLIDEDVDWGMDGEPSLSMVALYLGLDTSPSELSIPEGTTFVTATADAERAYRASLRGALEDVDIVLSNPTPHDPTGAPPEKGMVHAVALVNGRPWFDLDGGEYRRRKRDVTETMMRRLETHFPGLRDAVEVQETATPRTMFGYTRNHLGAVYGLAQTPAQSGAHRPGSRTPLPNLFRTGAWVLPGGGYSAATLSGLMTARDVGRHLETARPRAADRTDERFPVRVFYEDTDTDGVTYHVSYLRFFDRARTEMFMQVARERGLSLPRAVVTHVDVRYHRPSTLGDVMDIVTSARFVSDYRLSFEQRAVAADGAVLAEATTDLAFVDEDGRLVPCPVRAQLEQHT